MAAQRIVVVALVGEHDESPQLSKEFAGGLEFMLVARPQHEREHLAGEIDASVELRVPAALGFAQSPCFRASRMAAGILVNLDMGGVDDFETVRSMLADMKFQQIREDTALRPSQVESVNAVPFAKAPGKLVPLASGDQNPPDSVESFSKIGGFAAFFTNVRFPFAGVKLIFLGSRRARPALRRQDISWSPFIRADRWFSIT